MVSIDVIGITGNLECNPVPHARGIFDGIELLRRRIVHVRTNKLHVLHAALQRNRNFLFAHDLLTYIAYAQGDLAEMEKQESFIDDQPDLEASFNGRHGDIAASHGQIQKAREFYGFYLPSSAIVGNIQHSKIVRGLHDDVTKMRRIKRDLSVAVHADASELRFYAFSEATDRGVEVEETLCRTH